MFFFDAKSSKKGIYTEESSFRYSRGFFCIDDNGKTFRYTEKKDAQVQPWTSFLMRFKALMRLQLGAFAAFQLLF
jgi:hypothetical protein